MKFFCTYVLCFIFAVAFAQDKTHTTFFDVNNFKGNIALHNNEILHLITGHPAGVILSWNKKTYGFEDWEQRFNYPDYGVSFAYQDMDNPVLGDNYSLYAHYNFYFFKRYLMFRIGQGMVYNTNPYDKETNFKNVAYGTRLGSSTYLMLNFKKERLIAGLGLQAGFSLIHYSNANFKSPNNSTNSITFNFGFNYNLDAFDLEYQNTLDKQADKDFYQPIKYNFVFRTGINESDIVGSGQYAMYVLSAYADKRINKTSALQLGTEVFFSNFLKEYIYYRSVAFPEDGLTGREDHKRIGIFAGHELFINKTSLVTQLGYYVYYPFDFEGQTYVRIGLKRYFYKNWFGTLTLKSHGAKAEGVEFGVGIRL